jgi:hypothetical protein
LPIDIAIDTLAYAATLPQERPEPQEDGGAK